MVYMNNRPNQDGSLDSTISENPLLWSDEIFPRFDKIRTEHFAPALSYVLNQARQVIEQVSQDGEPTLANTVEPLEKTFNEINKVAAVFYHLNGVQTNDELDDLADEYAPIFSEFYSTYYQNSAIYERIATLLRNTDKDKDPVNFKMLEEMSKDFVTSGASLSDDEKKKLQEIDKKLSQLTTTMTKFCTKNMNNAGVLVTDEEKLAGLDEEDRAYAKSLAEEKNQQGFWLSVMSPSQPPLLASLEDKQVRADLLASSLARGSKDDQYNSLDTIKEIALLRLERAQLLGYSSHAELVVDRNVAPDTTAVKQRLYELSALANKSARHELEQIEKFAGTSIASSDWVYYAEKLREQEYKVDYNKLTPYFPLDKAVNEGILYIAHELYGLTFTPNDSYPKYRDDISIWDVYDENNKHIGIFLLDPFARHSKRGGAWMNTLTDQSHLLNEIPIVCNTLNVSKPSSGAAYLTFDNVRTLFHEFGHALHGLLSDVHYPSHSGTHVPTDFVEFPSQLHEMWLSWPQVVERYTCHKKTGEPLPQETLDAIEKSSTFGEGFNTYEYLGASVLDWAYHSITSPEQLEGDWEQFESKALQDAGLTLELIPPRYRAPYFQHIFAGGYSAGYYSYIWAEVLDANISEWTKNNGGLTRENGKKLRDNVLSQGGSTDAMESFRKVYGQEENIDDLLKRRGLIPS